jgi:hypothetical protein
MLPSADYVASIAPWAALPVCLGTAACSLFSPSARRLRAVGWTLVGTMAVSAGLPVAALRFMR